MINRFVVKSALAWCRQNWPVVLGLLATALYLVYLCSRLDPDFGWHLRVGEDFWKNQIFPRNDFYTFSFQGYAWRDHEWLAEAPLYWLYQRAGYWSLSLLFAGLWFLPFWWLIREKNLVIKVLMILVAMGAISPYVGVRLQVLTLVGLALFFRLFDSFLSGDRKLLIFFPLTMIFWANLHGSFVYGLLVGGIFLIYLFIRHQRSALAFLISYLTGFALTLLNPYGIGLWQEIVVAADPAYKKMIAEWHTLLSWPINYLTILYLLFFLVFWLANRKQQTQFKSYYLVSVLAFLVLALISRRNVSIFVLLSAPLFIELLRRDYLIRQIKARRLIAAGSLVLVSALIIISQSIPVSSSLKTVAFDGSYKQYPSAQIIDKLSKLPAGTPVFASYDFGGFLIQSNPNIKVFIDGRASYWRLGDELGVRRYFNIINKEADFNSAQSNYNFDVVLTGGLSTGYSYDPIFNHTSYEDSWSNLAFRLLKTGNWRVVAKNDNNEQLLLVRKNSNSEKCLGSGR